MGRLSRTYSGADSLVGLVVVEGDAEGTCAASDGTGAPLGICVSQSPSGLCDIATQGEVAFATAGEDIAFNASNFVTSDSDGKIVTFDPTTTEAGVYQVGVLVRPSGAAVVTGELVEVAINFAAVPAAGGE